MNAECGLRNAKSLALVAVVALAAGACIEPSLRPRPMTREVAVEHYKKAQELVQAQDIDLAIVAIRKAVAADPRQAEYHRFLANLLAQKTEWVDAEMEYRAAIRTDATNDLAWEGLVYVVRAEGQKDRLPGIIKERVGLSPLDAKWRMRLGLAYEDLGQLRNAEQALKDAADLAKGDQEAYILARLGLVYEALREPEKAIREYEQSLKLHPDQPRLREIVERLRALPPTSLPVAP